MGMCGYYISVNNSLLDKLKKGDIEVFDIDKNAMDIDKTWMMIHYLFCKNIDGGDAPMCYVVPTISDQMIENDTETAIFYLTDTQVKETDKYLQSLDDNAIKEMYDFNDMLENDVYPIWDRDSENEIYEYISCYIPSIKKFFKETAEESNSIIFYVI